MNHLLLLHSSLSSSAQWKTLIKSIDSEQFRINNVDLIGYGKQPIVEQLPAEKHSLNDEIDHFIDDLDQKPYHIIAHSFGAAVALKFAARFPERVASLCIFEPVAFYLFDENHPITTDIKGRFTNFEVQAQQKPSNTTKQFYEYWNGAGSFELIPTKLQQQFTMQISKVAMDFQAILHDDLKLADLNADMPTTLIRGSKTQAVMKTLMTELGNRFHTQVHEVNGGHMAPITQANEVNQLIRNHLDRFAEKF